MDARKKIALLIAEPDQTDQKNFIEGMLKQAFSCNYDVCVFAMYKMYQETVEREQGESKIFSLIPLDSFDAFVVYADSIQASGVADQIENELHTYFNKGPVLFVNKKSEYFPTVYMDDYTLSKALVEHLVQEHGYKDLAYLAGKVKDYHTKDRLRAFEDCMKEHGLAIRQDRVYPGDYWYSSGESMVERLMKKPDDLPEAIVCANDCMAIGVAAALTKVGKRVPEDIAVVGLDCTEEGMRSPSPLTSVCMPYGSFGEYVMDCLQALFDGELIPDFTVEPELFVGRSCGCSEYQIPQTSLARESWDSENSRHGFYTNFNPMMEDLMCQSTLQDLYNMIFSYAYQIGDFENFYLCLNRYWSNEDALIDLENDWKNYSDKMLLAVQCGRDSSADMVSTDELFDTAQLIPELQQFRPEPKAYFFTPVYFEDRCMGYSVLSFGSKPCGFETVYRAWMKNVMRGLESFRRLRLAMVATKRIEVSEYEDDRMGISNYKGFMKKMESLIVDEVNLQVLAVDIKGLAKINHDFGREEGDQAIITVGHMIKKCENAKWCCWLGNDEFLMASDVEEDAITLMTKELETAIASENENHDAYEYAVCFGGTSAKVASLHDVRQLMDKAVSLKNGNKLAEKRNQEVVTFTEEEKQVADIVEQILDQNLFTYHFQPIVDAKTGEIFSYEALMRTTTEQFVSPLDVIKYAGALGRLYDVEHATFFNITNVIGEKENLFEGKKVFINSIPGAKLSETDMEYLDQFFLTHLEQVVIELTEQAELDDAHLAEVKEKFAEVGVEMAVDDYGTGYSNVTNLLRYMPRYVKIDRMLLSEIQNSPQKQHFVKEIVGFAHNNNILALAEGVETVEELEMVIHLGADLIQGYYVARPNAEILQSVPVNVKREIVQFNLQEQYNKDAKLYVAGKDFRISLAKLVADDYECIMIPSEDSTYRDLNITGVPSLRSDINIQIAEGYQGRVTLTNVSLGGKRGQACIVLGENCDVTLILQGENELRTGGILVPESSKLTLEGDGSLYISCNYDNYYGIGNRLEQRHGELHFEQTGSVEIQGNGTCGVAIGSGHGGKIFLNSGKTIVNMTGKLGVAVGCLDGDTEVELTSCDLFMNGSVYAGVGIGAVTGKLTCRTKHIAINGRFSGTDWVGIGAHHSKDSDIVIHNCSVTLVLNALKVTGIGSFDGASKIDVRYASINLHEIGDTTLAVGDYNSESVLEIHDAEMNLEAKAESDFMLGISKENLFDENGRLHFQNNGIVIPVQDEE